VFAVWIARTSNSRIRMRAIADSGTVGAPVDLGPGTDVRIGGGPGGQLVATTTTAATGAPVVVGFLLDATGKPGASFTLAAAYQGTAGAEQVIATRDLFLVATYTDVLRLVPVSHAGVVGASLGLGERASSIAGASDGAEALVVWTDGDPGQIRGRFNAGGAWRGGELTILSDRGGSQASMAWDGSRYWVVWPAATGVALEGRSVDSDGRLSPVFEIVSHSCFAPSLASNGQGQLLVSCPRHEATGGGHRVISHVIELEPLPDIVAPVDAGDARPEAPAEAPPEAPPEPAADAGVPPPDAGAPPPDAGGSVARRAGCSCAAAATGTSADPGAAAGVLLILIGAASRAPSRRHRPVYGTSVSGRQTLVQLRELERRPGGQLRLALRDVAVLPEHHAHRLTEQLLAGGGNGGGGKGGSGWSGGGKLGSTK